MPETLTADEATTTRRSPTPFILAAVALIVGIAVVVGLESLSQTPDRVDELTVVNPTVYELTLRVQTDTGVRTIGQVPADSTYSIFDVLDEGETWDISFSTQGVDAGSATFVRQESDPTFQIEVPVEVGTRLAEAGVTPSIE